MPNRSNTQPPYTLRIDHHAEVGSFRPEQIDLPSASGLRDDAHVEVKHTIRRRASIEEA